MATFQHTTVTVPPTTKIAALFNLEDEAERQIFDILQRFYDPTEADRLCAIRRSVRHTVQGPRRSVLTLGYFRPQRRAAKTEWTVIAWDIDAIEMRMHPCASEQIARAFFAAASESYPTTRKRRLTLIEKENKSLPQKRRNRA